MTRIDGLNPLNTGRALQGQGANGVDGRGNAHAAEGTERAAGQDNISVSPRARVMSLATRAVRDAPDVRADKVAALKAAIADGSYRSDSRAIAARLLATGALDD